jgi:hypothetical protein
MAAVAASYFLPVFQGASSESISKKAALISFRSARVEDEELGLGSEEGWSAMPLDFR